MHSLHPQLAADCHQLLERKDSWVLLHRNSLIPWFILVPKSDAADLLDLPEADRNRLMDQAARIGQFVKERWGLSKTNFASLGNVVPQMHLHIIGRSPEDACWPKPVWGNLREMDEYPSSEVEEIASTLKTLLS